MHKYKAFYPTRTVLRNSSTSRIHVVSFACVDFRHRTASLSDPPKQTPPRAAAPILGFMGKLCMGLNCKQKHGKWLSLQVQHNMLSSSIRIINRDTRRQCRIGVTTTTIHEKKAKSKIKTMIHVVFDCKCIHIDIQYVRGSTTTFRYYSPLLWNIAPPLAVAGLGLE